MLKVHLFCYYFDSKHSEEKAALESEVTLLTYLTHGSSLLNKLKGQCQGVFNAMCKKGGLKP